MNAAVLVLDVGMRPLRVESWQEGLRAGITRALLLSPHRIRGCPIVQGYVNQAPTPGSDLPVLARSRSKPSDGSRPSARFSCGGGRAARGRGASLGRPRWSSTRRMLAGAIRAARILMRPLHLGHSSTSTRNTRLSSTAHGNRPSRGIPLASSSPGSPEATERRDPGRTAPGTTFARSLAAGPRMP
jgi:hypothetical protein